MPKKIAFFDFDGTITTKDTMLALARFHAGDSGFRKKMLLLSLTLIGLKLNLVTATVAKEKFLGSFFGGMDIQAFDKLCRQFTHHVLPGLIRPKALEAIQTYQKEKTKVVVVTASAENWVKQWCDQMGIECIGTQLKTAGQKITGQLLSANCNGVEKVNRIRRQFNLSEYIAIDCFGDSSGDQEMLAIGTRSIFKPFRN